MAGNTYGDFGLWYHLRASKGKDVIGLQESISIIKGLLYDAEKKQATDGFVKVWLGRLENMAFEVDNVCDDISYQHLYEPTENKKTVMKKLQSKFSSSSSSKQLSDRIRDIKVKWISILSRAQELRLPSRVANTQPPVFESLETGTDSVHVRKNDVSMIVEKLIHTTPSPTEKVLSVLPIVGIGGLGKTALAQEVLGDAKTISHFGHNRVLVHVPEIFDVGNILKSILTSLTQGDFELETREAILEKLQEQLNSTRRYMLVLDHVRNVDRKVWEEFVNTLTGISPAAGGNCLIVTTRSEVVASIVETLPVHKLESLSEDDCWSIIGATAFNRSGHHPSEFQKVGRNIAKRCWGLPLAAKLVGGWLRNKSKDEWLKIEKNYSNDDSSPIFLILKRIFDHLSSSSLECIGYCSIFPKGYRIEKDQLTELWMAEGFQTEILQTYLQDSLLQVAERDDYGNITHFNMHHLVHDLAWPILGRDDIATDDIRQSRYIGYKHSGDGLLSIPKGKEKYVRTLFFGGEVSDIEFSSFESLHSLTLVGSDIDELPTPIGELKHLRYLDISETSIRYLPESIGKLYYMQTLRAKKKDNWMHSYLVKLPDSLSFLVNLRHLHISEDTKLSPEIGKLTSLQTLSCFCVGSDEGYGISELGSLKDLKGKLVIRNLEKVRDKNEAMSADLLGKTGIYELKLVWDESRQGDEANDESVLEGLQPHPNLKGLKIYGFKGKSLPLWANVVFLALERLELCGVQNLEWDEVDFPPPSQLFTRLKYLRVEECKQLTMAPSHFPCLEELVIDGMEKLEIRSCPMTTHLIPSTGGWHNIIVKAEAERKIVFSASLLKQLNIYNCSSLRELPDDLGNLNSLEVLKINGCPNLKSIPYPVSSSGGGQQQQGFTSLRSLAILDCEGLSDLPVEMVEPYAASLEELELSGITNLGMVIECLHKMTRLRELSISSVPEFSVKDVDIGSLSTNSSLQTLRMCSSSSDNNVFFNKTVDAMLQQFVSLCSLELYGMEHWDRLPDQLQHHTSLEELYLHDFGIEALPDLFGNLSSSLKELHLLDCKKLRHLPSKECLSNLTLLEIKRCPLLLKEKRSNNNHNNYDYNHDYDYDYYEIPQIDDSEWPKISHIRTIRVDDHRRYPIEL